MHWISVVIVILCAGLLSSLTSADNLPKLPNPDCNSDGRMLRCNNVDIPGNFSATLIPNSVRTISIGWACVTLQASPDVKYYCNVFGDVVDPFPSSLTSLNEVLLARFRSKQGGEFRFDVINAVLGNVKGQLTSLHIFQSNLRKLGSRCFKGYSNLQNLWLDQNKIQDISSEVFVEMTDAGMAPVLSELYLSQNAITSFDWGALQPVAASLRKIHLMGQTPGLQKLFHGSAPFVLPSVVAIQLDDNKLSSIQKDVLDTLPGTKKCSLGLTNNGFCPDNPDCACCAMKDLVEWTNIRAQQGANFTIYQECGFGNQTLRYIYDSSVWTQPIELTLLTGTCP